MILGSFFNRPLNKGIHYELAILLDLLRDHYIINQLIKQTLCDSLFIDLIKGTFGIVPVIYSETKC